MINKVAHFSDIHIRKSTLRHDEYKKIFNDVYNKLIKDKPDRIVIVGDLYHDFLDQSGEAQLLMASFLNNLARISTVVIVRGNHDLMKKNLNRIDVIESLTKLINNPNVIYYNQSGFYEDDNVVWVVWNHRDKNIVNPWVDIQHPKKKDKIYIDLFHDPIDGCLDHQGKPMRGKYEPVTSFKGDFTFAGDLHYYQVFGKNKTMAYPSSLIQQNFGETPDSHGFIMWDLKNKTHDFIEVINEHTYINFDVIENTDYDKLKFESKFIRSNPEIKVKWSDLSSNVNKENEIKIRKYIKEKYGLNKIRIEKNPIYTSITDVKMVNEGIDINNTSVQREIFIEYLKQNKYEQDFIDEILKLDDIVNSRLDLKEHVGSINWRVEKFWFDNFKSYGDGNIIDWDRVNGIIQIHGENQQGKTTILDALCYILYGKTTTTQKPVKYGDNRYLNNKRDLDTCVGGAVININDEQYTLVRRTTRTWNRSKTEVTGSKTDLELYLGSEVKEEFKMNEETLKKTQPIIESALGDLKDFIRIILTNADNLNDLLSMDRAVFIDSIIKDAGYDIFELKLEEFKVYVKELNEEKINLDILTEQQKIVNKQQEKDTLIEKLNTIIEQLETKKELLKTKQQEKESTITKLYKIDESVENIDLDTLNKNIIDNKFTIGKNNSTIDDLAKKRDMLSNYVSFDYDKYEKKNSLLTENKDKLSNLKVDISTLTGEIKNLELSISQTQTKVDNAINNRINKLTNENSNLNNIVENKKKEVIQSIKDYMATLKDDVQTNKNEVEKIKIKQEGIKEKTLEFKAKISEIEESNVCIECGRPFTDGEHLEHVKSRIAEYKQKITTLHEEYKVLELDKEPYQTKINSVVERTTKIQNKNFEDEPELKKTYDATLLLIKNTQNSIGENDKLINKLKEGIYDGMDDLIQEINSINMDKSKSTSLIESKKQELSGKNTECDNIQKDIDTLADEIKKLSDDKINYELKLSYINELNKITLETENLTLKVKSDEQLIKLYDSQQSNIEYNKTIQKSIDDLQVEINSINDDISKLQAEKEETNSSIVLIDNDIKHINELIKKFEEQQHKYEIRKAYTQAIHRDGIPTYLLKKSIHIINQKLSNLLSNVDFSVYFDDELTLKLSSDSRLDVSQNAVESSGKERTFSAIALKIALREINKKSKPDFVLFDEVMGKLVSNSVDEFIEFLDVISKEVGKLVIIEHVHQINYDAIIEVKKDVDGVSTLEFNS